MLAQLLGGLGLFLLGMTMMTDGLKGAAGASLQDWLARFTRGRLSAMLTGLGFTLLIQSSSAATLAAIGFVNAGLLTLAQALGVLYGANLGTTMTGWMVGLLGFKVQISAFALPAVGIGVVMRMLQPRGRSGSIGTGLAGFGLLFLGISVMQGGMAGVDGWGFTGLDPDAWLQRAMLVGIGVVMTAAMQSSSAALAVTLTALAGGLISLPQAAALAIGQNVGTTITAMLASIGGTADARRAALAHVLFNGVTGLVAFVLFTPFLFLVHGMSEWVGGAAIQFELALFHTVFNVLGVALMLPWVEPTARMLQQRFGEAEARDPSLPRHLDDSALSVPESAMAAVDREIAHLSELVAEGFQTLLAAAGPRGPVLAETQAQVERLAEAIAGFLERVGHREAGAPRIFLQLRTVDHLQHMSLRLLEAARTRDSLREGPRIEIWWEPLRNDFERLGQVLPWAGVPDSVEAEAAAALYGAILARRESRRAALYSDAALADMPAREALHLGDLVQVQERAAYHLSRAAHYWHASDPATVTPPAPEETPPVPGDPLPAA